MNEYFNVLDRDMCKVMNDKPLTAKEANEFRASLEAKEEYEYTNLWIVPAQCARISKLESINAALLEACEDAASVMKDARLVSQDAAYHKLTSAIRLAKEGRL